MKSLTALSARSCFFLSALTGIISWNGQWLYSIPPVPHGLRSLPRLRYSARYGPEGSPSLYYWLQHQQGYYWFIWVVRLWKARLGCCGVHWWLVWRKAKLMGQEEMQRKWLKSLEDYLWTIISNTLLVNLSIFPSAREVTYAFSSHIIALLLPFKGNYNSIFADFSSTLYKWTIIVCYTFLDIYDNYLFFLTFSNLIIYIV